MWQGELSAKLTEGINFISFSICNPFSFCTGEAKEKSPPALKQSGFAKMKIPVYNLCEKISAGTAREICKEESICWSS